MKVYSLLFLSFFIGKACFADWNASSLTTGNEWNQNEKLFSDPFSATIWGTLKENQVDLSDDELLNDTIYVQTPYYQHKQTAYLTTQKQLNSPFTRKAPLMVILPGIFSASLNGNEIAKAEAFSAQGYHVLILSNPWSLDSIGKNPANKPGDIENETRWILASIQKVVTSEINPDYVSSISLYGESYGAFLAGMTAAMDDVTHPLIDGKVMLVSPPLNLASALEQLDAAVDETLSQQDFCKKNEVRVGVDFMFVNSGSALKPDSANCARALVGMTFNGGLSSAMSAMMKTSLPVPHGAFQSRFTYYIQNFAPEQNQLCQSTDKCNLVHWVTQAEAAHKNLQIVASSDDFLNVNSSWDQVTRALPNPSSELVLLTWGGHLGFVGSPKYSAFYSN